MREIKKDLVSKGKEFLATSPLRIAELGNHYYHNMNKIKSICVFCGSSESVDTSYKKVAMELGCAIGKKGIDLIYGGASIGLMGCVARGVHEEKGNVIGILPEFFQSKDIYYQGFLLFCRCVDQLPKTGLSTFDQIFKAQEMAMQASYQSMPCWPHPLVCQQYLL